MMAASTGVKQEPKLTIAVLAPGEEKRPKPRALSREPKAARMSCRKFERRKRSCAGRRRACSIATMERKLAIVPR